MIDAFLSWQAGVLVATLAVFIVFRQQAPSRHALLAIACYGASVFLFNVWVFVPSSTDPVENAALLDYAYKVFNAGVNGSLVVYLGALLYVMLNPMEEDDLPARLLWICVFIAEVWGLLFNNIGCNLIMEDASQAELAASWGTSASKYVCGREVGEWFEFMPLLIEIGLMVWLVHRFVLVHEKVNAKD